MNTVAEESKVAYNYLGRSGLKVSNLTLGCMTFGVASAGLPGQCDEESSHKVIDRYVQWGGNVLDTANVYSDGLSENIIGSWLSKQSRDDFVVATKVRGQEKPVRVDNRGLSRRHIVHALEGSLERLKTDYVDLYQMHLWDDATPIEETLRTLDDLVRCGKVRYVGASNVVGWQLQKIVDLTEKMGFNPCVSLQQQYSLAVRECEFEVFQVCKQNGIGVLPWSPLKGGLLSGKYQRDTKPSEGRIGWVMQDEPKRATQACPAWGQVSAQDRVWNTLDVMKSCATKHGKSVAQVALRWLLQKDVVSSVVIGARTLDQLDDNMGAANGWKLTHEEMTQLDQASQPEVPYPYEMVWRLNKDRCNTFVPSFYVGNTC
ncbi:1-deoxyxylulose-5-phosphate synthase YajO-like [Gigantopelta aegis]|uniref:1-deoxyxylulose-5-phosphate synthase YajO-like n=1 Tax=Gigantopelta aegis TaxID=1735272 RepID=UPI001B888510|nr:1-deoxyxylulose-5-phosphate synthase YajO-like [Gigantopelta aegis]